MRSFVRPVLCIASLLASSEGFVISSGAAKARRAASTLAEEHIDKRTRSRSHDDTTSAAAAAAAASVVGRTRPSASASRLFAKATYRNFEDMLEKEPGAILVDFYATWCGPCKMMAENLAVVGPKMKDELKIFKIDTDKYPKLMAKFGVNGLPTLVLFKEGKELQRIEGVLPAEAIVQQLRYFLAGAAAQGAGVPAAGNGGDQEGGDACCPTPASPPRDACAPPPPSSSGDACAPPPQQ